MRAGCHPGEYERGGFTSGAKWHGTVPRSQFIAFDRLLGRRVDWAVKFRRFKGSWRFDPACKSTEFGYTMCELTDFEDWETATPTPGCGHHNPLLALSLKGNQMLSPPAGDNQNSPQPRAGKHAGCRFWCGVLESAWSPDAQKPPRGVHRRPPSLVLSLLFLVRIPVTD